MGLYDNIIIDREHFSNMGEKVDKYLSLFKNYSSHTKSFIFFVVRPCSPLASPYELKILVAQQYISV
jgi:hypothetical protein